jgi:hypothetical protein
MRIKQTEFKYIKSKLPSISYVLNEDFYHLKEIRHLIKIEIYTVTLWNSYLNKEEYDKFFNCTKEEEIQRREKFLSLFSILSFYSENIYTWNYNTRNKRNEIRRLTPTKKYRFQESIKNYTIDNTEGIFKLIIPELSAIVKMGCDWCCTICCNENQDNSKIFEIIKRTDLKYFRNE